MPAYEEAAQMLCCTGRTVKATMEAFTRLMRFCIKRMHYASVKCEQVLARCRYLRMTDIGTRACTHSGSGD